MPASPITKNTTLPENWVHLQKTIIPDTETSCYWSVWFTNDTKLKGTAWLMWCPLGEDPSLDDNWGHVEELMDDCKNILVTIKEVFGVSFHDKIGV